MGPVRERWKRLGRDQTPHYRAFLSGPCPARTGDLLLERQEPLRLDDVAALERFPAEDRVVMREQESPSARLSLPRRTTTERVVPQSADARIGWTKR
jgi:hypothetical protein